MGTKFTYALALTIAGAVFNLVMYFLGFQTDKMAAGQYFQWIGLIITIAVLWLGIKAVREESPDKSLSYGQGVGAGTLISFYSGLMSAVYTYIHFKFINPSFFDYQAAMMRDKMAAKGMSDTQIEQASTMMQKFSGPGVSACVTPFIVVLFGLIISLILAAILKRAAAPAGAPAATA
jgi:hypothetical protein